MHPICLFTLLLLHPSQIPSTTTTRLANSVFHSIYKPILTSRNSRLGPIRISKYIRPSHRITEPNITVLLAILANNGNPRWENNTCHGSHEYSIPVSTTFIPARMWSHRDLRYSQVIKAQGFQWRTLEGDRARKPILGAAKQIYRLSDNREDLPPPKWWRAYLSINGIKIALVYW